jgi:hypothetical protein
MLTQEIKNKLNELYQNTPDYVGVGYGHKTIKGVETSDKSIVFTVPKKISLNEIPFNERLPEFVEISGTIYRTDVIEIGKVVPMTNYVVCNNPLINPSCYTWSPLGSVNPPNRNTLRPLVGGISLTADRVAPAVGTLGLIVVDSLSQKLVGLTNNHVVVQDASYTSYRNLNNINYIVNEYKSLAYQSGEVTTSVSTRIGEVVRYVPLKSQPELNTVDGALVSLCANTVSNTTSFTQLGINYSQPMPFATTAEIDSLLATPRTILSSGRTSGVKSGDCGLKIKYLGATQTVGSYPLQGEGRVVSFNDLIVFTRLSEGCNFPIYGGDSGSVLIADFDGIYKIIGLNFAGSSQLPGSTTDIGQYGYACRIDNVAFELGIEAWNGTLKNTVSTIEKVITSGGSPNKTIIVDGKTYWQVGLSRYLN